MAKHIPDDHLAWSHYWGEVYGCAREISGPYWKQPIAWASIPVGIVTALVTGLLMGWESAWQAAVALTAGIVGSIICGLIVFMFSMRKAVYEVHRRDVADGQKLEADFQAKIHGLEAAVKKRQSENVSLREAIDTSGSIKKPRVDFEGKGFLRQKDESGEDCVYAVLWGVTIVNPNDRAMDVKPELSLELEVGGTMITAEAIAWPIEHLKKEITDKGMAAIGQHFGPLVAIEAQRTVRGYVFFHLPQMMLFLLRKLKPGDAIRFWLRVEDSVTSVEGRRMVIVQPGAHPALLNLHEVLGGFFASAPPDDADASSGGTPHTDDKKSE